MHVDACVYNHATILLYTIATDVSARVNAVPVYLVAHTIDARFSICGDSERWRIDAWLATYGCALAVLVLVHGVGHKVLHGVHTIIVVVDIVFAVLTEVDICVSAHPRTFPIKSNRNRLANLGAQTVVEAFDVQTLLCLLVYVNLLCAVAA